MKHESRRMSKRAAFAPPSPRTSGGYSKAMAEQGQVMLLTVMMLTGVILSTTSLVALLVLYQLRQTTDVIASSQAIFAADAGLECVLYREVKKGNSSEWGDCSAGKLSNGAEFKTLTEGSTIKSVGRSGRSARAFEANF